MLINVHCPKCGSRYNLKPELRGQKMRCPNTICREVFEVRESTENETVSDGATAEAPAPAESLDSARKPPGTEKKYVAGSIGEMVPFLASEAVEIEPAQPQAEEAPAAPNWQAAPPPVRRAPAESPGDSRPPLAPKKDPPPLAPKKETASPGDALPTPPKRTAPTPAAPPPAAKPETPAAPAAQWWDVPPPVRGPKQPGDKETKDVNVKETLAPMPKPQAPAGPAAKSWDPPPVRRGAQTLAPTAKPPAEEAPPTTHHSPLTTHQEATPEDEYAAPATRRAARWAIPIMLLFVLGVAGVAAFFVFTHQKATEDELVQKAKESYEAGTYAQAAKLYDDVLKNFPDSGQAAEYRFWKDFAGARHQVKSYDVAAEPALEQLRGFLKKYKDDPLLAKYKPDVWDSYRMLLRQKFLPAKDDKITKENVRQYKERMGQSDEVLREAEKFTDDPALESKELRDRFAEVEAAIVRLELVQTVVARLEAMKEPTWDDIQAVERDINQLNLAGDPDVQPLLTKLRSDWLYKGNRYVAGAERTLPAPPPEDSGLPVVPRLDTAPTGKAPGVVLALARGVLYALSEADGRLLWWTRVGIDTTTLPVRLPAGETNPEVVLVLSSDSNTVTARAAQTGEALWRYDLGAPCLGRPVIVGRRAYIATTVKNPGPDGQLHEEGRVHEIEIVRGTVLGEYKLGLPLSGSGARQPGTGLLYFPADRGYVYVLDVDKKQCAAMLHTGHPSGSLRGEPILVSDDAPMASAGTPTGPPRYLVLSQADGLDAMKLRAYRLPLEKVVNTPPLQPEPKVRGWSWFQPHCDGEKIIIATDAGVLGLYGLNQFHNTDPTLFPLFGQEIKLQGAARRPGRAQVVQATESDFWILAQGVLQHWRMGLAADGQKIAALWKQPLELGAPLHAAQTSDDGETLFVVTHALSPHASLVTAIEADTGKVLWQRQLGLACIGDPVQLGGRVAALDQSGGMFVFDPEKKDPLLPIERGSAGTGAWLLPGDDGRTVYALSVPGPGRLTVRRHGPAKTSEENKPRDYPLPAPLAGTPAQAPGYLVMPLADGLLARLTLSANPKEAVDRGLTWRAPQADAGAHGHVTYLGGSDFLVADGSKGLRRVAWPAGGVWKILAEKQLDDRIVAAPLLISDPGDANPRVLVADSAGNLLLLALQGKEIKEVRRWALDGKVTAGPFLRGNRAGVIVDRRTLVWIDPSSDQPAWKHTVEGEAIVGQPQQIGNLVVVADVAGKFVKLDTGTGKPTDAGYTLKSSVAPAATPVMFGPDRLFAPLTDGTVLLLPIKPPEKQTAP